MDLLEIPLDETDRQHLILAYSYQGDIEELILTLEEQTQREEDEVSFLKRVPIINRSRTKSGLSALMISCLQGYGIIVEEILAHWSADPNLKVTANGVYKGMTALHFAVRNDETQCVELLLNARCNVNAVDANGNTPLIVASKHNCDESASYLLKCRGIDLDKQDNDGKSALMWACQLGHQSIVKRLLDSDANMTLIDKEGRNCIMHAAEYGHYRILQVIALFIEDNKLYNNTDNSGLTALHLAALNGHKDTLKYLFEVKDINMYAVDNEKRSILHAAMCSGNDHAIELILTKENQLNSNKPKLVNSEDSNKRTPLFYASLKGRLPSLPGVDPLFKDKFGLTALHWMCIRGNIRCLQHFKDIDSDKFRDSKGNSLLHAAAQYGHYKCCHFLINIIKCDVTAINKNKETPLHKAVAGNYHEVVHLLLSKGANLNATDVKGRTPLHKAAMNSASHSLTQLLERGAKVNLQDIYRRTALHYACIKGNETSIEVLLREDVNLSLLDNRKRSALHLACLYNKEECVQLLLNARFDVNGVDMYYATPIMYAAYKGDIEVVKLLESVQANVNLLDNSGRNCIHYACMGGNVDVVDYIYDIITLQHQISIDLTDKLNRTPLFYACSGDKEDLVEFLLEKGATLNTGDSLSQHPIYQASQNYDILNLLIEKGAKLNLKDSNGNTLLHLICKNSEKKFSSIVEEVLEQVPDLLHSKNTDGIQPIHVACLSGNYSVLSHLIDKGANINATDNIGRTPSHYAAIKGSKDCLLELATSDCDMDIKDKDGRLPLHLAVIKGNMECCSYLSARNSSDFSCTDNFGRTPFFYACKGKSNVHAEIADLLLEDSENNIQDEKLLSPLHFVVLNYHKSLLKRMLYSDINLDVKDAQGVTPLMVAAFKGYLGFVKLLVRRGADCNLLDSKGRNAYMFAKKFGRDNCKSYLEPRTIVKEAFIVDLSTEHSEVMRTPTRYGVNAEQQAGTPTGANEFLFADQEMTSNYPPSPCEETMDVSTSESTEFNFATQSTPFGVPYEQREDLLNGAQRLQQTYERLDAIERRQAEVPKRFDSLSDLLARNGQIEDEIQQLTQKVANANYQNDSKKLASLLHLRKQKPTKTIDTNTFTTPLYKKNNIQPYSEALKYHIIMIVLLSLTLIAELSILYY